MDDVAMERGEGGGMLGMMGVGWCGGGFSVGYLGMEGF